MIRDKLGRGDCCWNGHEIRVVGLGFGKLLPAGFLIFACPAALGGSVNVWGTWCTGIGRRDGDSGTGEGIASGVVWLLLKEGRPCFKMLFVLLLTVCCT